MQVGAQVLDNCGPGAFQVALPLKWLLVNKMRRKQLGRFRAIFQRTGRADEDQAREPATPERSSPG